MVLCPRVCFTSSSVRPASNIRVAAECRRSWTWTGGEHWALIALDLNVDPSTPAGEAMAAMLATFAQFERRLIGERTKSALAVKKAAGVRLGRPRLIPEEIAARIVAERSSGATLRAIADGLNRDAVPTAMRGRQWWVATVQGVLAQAGSSPASAASSRE